MYKELFNSAYTGPDTHIKALEYKIPVTSGYSITYCIGHRYRYTDSPSAFWGGSFQFQSLAATLHEIKLLYMTKPFLGSAAPSAV